jgi:hypothetical protein
MADEEDLLLVDLLTPENRRRDATMVTPQPTPTTPAVDQQPPQPTPAVDQQPTPTTPAVDQQPTPTTPAVDQQPTQKTPAVDVDQRPQTLSPPPLNLSNFQHPPSSIESSHHSPHVPLRNQPRSLSFSSQQPQVGMDVPAGPTPAPPGKDAAAADAASVNPNNIIGGAGALNANTRATRQAMAQLTGTPTKPKPRYKEPTPEEDAKLVAAAEARRGAGTDVDVDMTAVADHDGDGDVNMEEKKQDDEVSVFVEGFGGLVWERPTKPMSPPPTSAQRAAWGARLATAWGDAMEGVAGPVRRGRNNRRRPANLKISRSTPPFQAAASPDSAKELNDTINKIIGQPAPPASAKPVFSPDHPRSTPRRVSDVDRAKAESSNPNHPMPPYRTGSAKPQSNDSDHINASFSSQFKYIFRTSGLIVGADSREFDWNYPARAIVDDHGHESQPFIHRPCLVHELVGPYRAGSVTHDAPPLRFVPRWNQSSIADGKCLIYSGQAALGGEEYPRMDPESTLVEDQAAAVRKMKDCRNEMANFVTEVMGLEAEEDADKEAIRQKHRLLLIHIFQLQPDADINTHNIQRFVERTCDEQMSFEEETAAVFGVMKGRSLQVTRYIPLSMDPMSNANLFVNASDVDRYSGLIASTPQTRFAYPLGDTIPEMKESDIKGRQFAFEGLKFPYYHAETVTLINYKRRLPTRGDPGGPGHYECTYLASDYYDTTFNHPRCMSQPTVMLPAVYGHRPRHFLTPVLSAPLFEHLDKTIVADQSRYAKAGMIVKCIRSDTEYLVLATMIHIMSTAPEFEGVRHLTSKDDSDTIGRRAFDDFVQKAGSPMSMPVEKVLLLEIPPASTTTREAVQDFLDEISTDENLAQQRANFSVVPFERIVTVTQLPEVSKQRREEDGEPCELYVKGTDEVFKVRSFVARKLKLRDEFIDQAAAFLAEATDLVATVHALDQPNGDQSNDMVSRFRQFEAYISNPIRCQALVGYELSDVGVDRILDDTIWGGMDEKHEPMKAMNEWLEVTSEFATTPAAITEAAAKKPAAATPTATPATTPAAKKPAAATPTAKKPAAKKPAAPKKPAATKYQKIVYTEPRVPLDSLDERTRSSVRRFEVPADGVTNVDSLTHWLATCALRLCCHYKSMRSFFSHYTEADSIYHLLYSHLDKLLRKLPPATPSNHEDYIPHYIDPQRRPLTKMSNISTFMNCLLSYLAKNDAQAYVLYHLAVDRHEFERKLGELDQPFRRDFPSVSTRRSHARPCERPR